MAVRCIRECGLNVGAGAGLGSADLILVSGLEGGDAIGKSFRESGRYINRLPENERGVVVAHALVEDFAALLRGDDVEQRRHDVHGRNFERAAIGQDQGDLVALEGVELFACDHGLPPPFRVGGKLVETTFHGRPTVALRRKLQRVFVELGHGLPFDFAAGGRAAGRGFAAVVLFGPRCAGGGVLVRVGFDRAGTVEAVGFVVGHGRVLQIEKVG